MWPFKKKPPPAPPARYTPTALQDGDECCCVDDSPHVDVHQKLLVKGCIYTVRKVHIGGLTASGYGGPWIKLVGIVPINDASWRSERFEKVIKVPRAAKILDQVMEPAGLDVEKERELATHLGDKP